MLLLPKILMVSETSDAVILGAEDIYSNFCVNTVDFLAAAVLAVQDETSDCVLINGEIADYSHAEILETIQNANSLIPVVFYSANMTAQVAVNLIRSGAFSCLCLRASAEELCQTLESAAAQKAAAERACRNFREARQGWREILVGDSPAMEAVAETINLVGKRRCTVLISGETGTGKEMAARALHAASPRGQFPMVAVNCSALPENLLEAELFGHTKGAFTGAMASRIGRFEQANKGTIFLDEIGDMPIDLQAKLLRVLQEREIQRLGSSETIKVDVRVIAATNVDLQEKIRQGKFREDLYYRLNVVPLQMPPLRKRCSDIPALVHHFIRKSCAMEGIPLKRIAPETVPRLRSQPWPGNVRELENAVEKAVVMSGDADFLTLRDFGLTAGPVRTFARQTSSFELPSDDAVDFDTAVSQFELAMLDRALRKTGGNKTAAAEHLGMKRTTLIMKMRSYENNGFVLERAS